MALQSIFIADELDSLDLLHCEIDGYCPEL